jgi:IclR family KDG regulon transcriptional repressor
MAQRSRDYTIQALHHALTVLETFLEPGNAVQGVSEIGERLAMNKSRVFRILTTFEQHRFVQRDPETKQYQLGVALMVFGEAVRRRLEVIQVASPILDELAEITGETVHLGIVDGDEAVCVARRMSQHSVRLYAEVGRRAPLHVGGIPKLLLAYLPADERRRILHHSSLNVITDLTITDPDELERHVAQIQTHGYHVSVGDLDPDVHSIAAPIYDHSGQVVAGLSVAGPSPRFPPDKVQEYIDLVCQAAARISHLIGYTETAEAQIPPGSGSGLPATEQNLATWPPPGASRRRVECQS